MRNLDTWTGHSRPGRDPTGTDTWLRLCARAMANNAVATMEAATQSLKELDRLRREQDLLIRKINKFHTKLAQTPPETAEKYQDKLWIKLRDWYTQVKALAESEDSVSVTCLNHLDVLISPSQSQTVSHRRKADGGEQKRKRAKADSDSSRLSSPTVSRMSADSTSIAVGDQVAARITPEDAEKSEWIVVKVTRFDRETNKYEVIDEEPGDDEENGNGPRKYKLASSCIIQLPRRTEPATALDFPTSSQVLAVYPGTTALYKATVVGPHRKRKTDDYTLEFDDDEEDGFDGLPKRTVPFYHVVTLPEGHRQ